MRPGNIMKFLFQKKKRKSSTDFVKCPFHFVREGGRAEFQADFSEGANALLRLLSFYIQYTKWTVQIIRLLGNVFCNKLSKSLLLLTEKSCFQKILQHF